MLHSSGALPESFASSFCTDIEWNNSYGRWMLKQFVLFSPLQKRCFICICNLIGFPLGCSTTRLKTCVTNLFVHHSGIMFIPREVKGNQWYN